MTFNRYLFSRGIWRQSFRQHGWIGILYLLGLLFSLPFQLILLEEGGLEPRELNNLFTSPTDIQLYFHLVIPMACAVFVFRYMQVKASADLFHSLPIRRESSFLSHLASGAFFLLVPIWCTAVITALIRNAVASSYLYSYSAVVSWAAVISILVLFFYSFTVFVGVCLGQSTLQAVVVYILLILPAGLIMLINFHFNTYLYGYIDMGWGGLRTEYWSPIIHLAQTGGSSFTWKMLAVYICLTLLFTGAALLLYRLRLAERATHAIAFTYFNPLFQLGVMLCAMLVSGTYFSEMKRHLGWTIAGYFIGAVLGYMLSEMVIRKSWYILNRKVPVYFLIYTAALSILLFISGSNLTGFETRVPESKSVQSVYMGEDLYYRSNLPRAMEQDPAYIEAVIQLHEKIVELGEGAEIIRKQNPRQRVHPIGIMYKLGNGNTMARHYWIPESLIAAELRPVMESVAYKKNRFNLDLLDKEIDRISLHDWGGSTGVGITDPSEINEFKEILKRDIMKMRFEQIVDDFHWASIDILFQDPKLHSPYAWSRSFKELEAWLEDKGYADMVRWTPKDVSTLAIVKLPRDMNSESYRPFVERFELLAEQSSPRIIQDKQVIGQLMEKLKHMNGLEDGYLVKLTPNEGNAQYFWLPEAELNIP
jgi:ABC-2 type transport system permease protein